MIWDYFIYVAVVAILLWCAGAWAAWKEYRRWAFVATAAGLLVFFSYMMAMWVVLERPPLRTMGETRLWYSFFLPLTGLVVYSRWHYRWLLSFSTLMAVVFICVNVLKPEIHSKTLMPALQSPWFAPHVIVYMFCYALLGAAAVMAIYLLVCPSRLCDDLKTDSSDTRMEVVDQLVRLGIAFMTVGMLFGALWAKEAWGHYWSWDPKETWAAVTWFACLAYLHFRLLRPNRVRPALWMLVVAFLLLQMCWWGINYLPSAQGTSVHTYGM